MAAMNYLDFANFNSAIINSAPGESLRNLAAKTSFSEADAFAARFLIAATLDFRTRRRRSSRLRSLIGKLHNSMGVRLAPERKQKLRFEGSKPGSNESIVLQLIAKNCQPAIPQLDYS
jgi:hypothetical protein